MGILQKGVGERAVNQLEKSVSSKLEATVARQIQAQYQTSGKQALQVIYCSYIFCFTVVILAVVFLLLNSSEPSFGFLFPLFGS